MAKDKGKKSTEFAKPSEATGGGDDSWSLTDGYNPKSAENDGELFLITPLRKHTASVTRGKKTEDVEVIVSDIVHLNEKKPAKSEEHDEVFVWAKWVQGSLRSYIGEEKVLGRLVKTPDSGSAVGYVWKLEDADDDDIEVARAYIEASDPFTKKSGKGAIETKAGKKSKAEPEPEKKSKKSKVEPEPAKKGKKSKAAPEPEPAKKGKKSKK